MLCQLSRLVDAETSTFVLCVCVYKHTHTLLIPHYISSHLCFFFGTHTACRERERKTDRQTDRQTESERESGERAKERAVHKSQMHY